MYRYPYDVSPFLRFIGSHAPLIILIISKGSAGWNASLLAKIYIPATVTTIGSINPCHDNYNITCKVLLVLTIAARKDICTKVNLYVQYQKF